MCSCARCVLGPCRLVCVAARTVLLNRDYDKRAPKLWPYNVATVCLYRAKIIPPRQSGFRVYAILTWEDTATGKTGWISGTNSESSYIGGAICAERAAATQLRELPSTVKVSACVRALCVGVGVGVGGCVCVYIHVRRATVAV